jgi:hypothetical protein
MDQLVEFVGKHYQWVFSGVGVALLLGLWKSRRSLPLVSQWQRGGAFSRNVQVGINHPPEREREGHE